MTKARLIKVIKNPKLLAHKLRELRSRLPDNWLRIAQFNFLNRIGKRYSIVRMKDHKLWIDLHDATLGRYFFVFREYEYYETFLLESYIKSGMNIVDIGANIGYYTIKFARKVTQAGHVYAFEPDTNNMSLLKRNLELNDINNVTCEQTAVMDKAGEIDFYLSDTNFGDHRSFLSHDEVVSNNGLPRKVTTISAIALDEYLNGRLVDLIKMDIQGAEVMALKGMIETLKNPNIILFCEFWPHGILESGHKPEQFLEILYNLGMKLYQIDETTLTVKPFENAMTEYLLETSKTVFSAHVNLICTHTKYVEPSINDRKSK